MSLVVMLYVTFIIVFKYTEDEFIIAKAPTCVTGFDQWVLTFYS